MGVRSRFERPGPKRSATGPASKCDDESTEGDDVLRAVARLLARQAARESFEEAIKASANRDSAEGKDR